MILGLLTYALRRRFDADQHAWLWPLASFEGFLELLFVSSLL